MKKMYKHPETEVEDLYGANLMLTVSEGGNDGPGSNDAPKRHETALPVPGGAL